MLSCHQYSAQVIWRPHYRLDNQMQCCVGGRRGWRHSSDFQLLRIIVWNVKPLLPPLSQCQSARLRPNRINKTRHVSSPPDLVNAIKDLCERSGRSDVCIETHWTIIRVNIPFPGSNNSNKDGGQISMRDRACYWDLCWCQYHRPQQ